jgi:hypothetical protein
VERERKPLMHEMERARQDRSGGAGRQRDAGEDRDEKQRVSHANVIGIRWRRIGVCGVRYPHNAHVVRWPGGA